jgi:hypothetical protein
LEVFLPAFLSGRCSKFIFPPAYLRLKFWETTSIAALQLLQSATLPQIGFHMCSRIGNSSVSQRPKTLQQKQQQCTSVFGQLAAVASCCPMPPVALLSRGPGRRCWVGCKVLSNIDRRRLHQLLQTPTQNCTSGRRAAAATAQQQQHPRHDRRTF